MQSKWVLLHQSTNYIYDLSDINNLKTCIVYDSVPYWRGNSIRYKLIPLTGIKIAIIVFLSKDNDAIWSIAKQHGTRDLSIIILIQKYVCVHPQE